MDTRFITWHIPNPGVPLPVFYIDRDSEPVALRIYAVRVPGAGDLLVDVLDDGDSIMKSNSYQTWAFKDDKAYIEFGTPSATAFQVGETISGGTSLASAKVTANNHGRLTLTDVSSTAFTVGETITGATSLATGVVNSYVRAIKSAARTTSTDQSHANLPKNKNSNDAAQDFQNSIYIAEGSWMSLSVLDMAGAGNVTVQLELEALSSSVESRRAN